MSFFLPTSVVGIERLHEHLKFHFQKINYKNKKNKKIIIPAPLVQTSLVIQLPSPKSLKPQCKQKSPKVVNSKTCAHVCMHVCDSEASFMIVFQGKGWLMIVELFGDHKAGSRSEAQAHLMPDVVTPGSRVIFQVQRTFQLVAQTHIQNDGIHGI